MQVFFNHLVNGASALHHPLARTADSIADDEESTIPVRKLESANGGDLDFTNVYTSQRRAPVLYPSKYDFTRGSVMYSR